MERKEMFLSIIKIILFLIGIFLLPKFLTIIDITDYILKIVGVIFYFGLLLILEEIYRKKNN